MKPIPGETPVVIRRKKDDGRRAAPPLTVAFSDLRDFHDAPGYLPGDPPRLGAWIDGGRREWSSDDEEVFVDPGLNALGLIAAVGHLKAGHACPDCAPSASE